MRRFVILAHEVPTEADFSLDDLPGSAGRLDLLARCVNTALLVSHGLRSDTRVHVVIDDTLTITLDGSRLQGLHPDERSTAARLQSAIEAKDEAIGHQPARLTPGLSIGKRGLDVLLEEAAEDGPIIHLAETGSAITDVGTPIDPTFVLSDHLDFTPGERETIESHGGKAVRLGPVVMHADQSIAVAHHYLDTDGYTAF